MFEDAWIGFGDTDDMSRIGGSAHVVDEEKLEEQEYNDIHRILREVPGVYARAINHAR